MNKNPDMALNIGLSLIAFMASAVITLWLQRRAVRLGLLDIPNDRSSHILPTPRGGGLAIAIVVLTGFPLLAWLAGIAEWTAVIVYCLSGALIVAVGWADDKQSLSAGKRLIVHIAVAGATIVGFGYFDKITLPIIGIISLGWAGIPLTLLWIVGLINAYNFMDGIDGLAAGQAVVAGAIWVVIGWEYGLLLVAGLGLLISATSLGFLPHNWSPARIFLGDSGSGFLGFSFAFLPLLAAHNNQADGYYAVCGALMMGIFIFDTGITFVRRLARRENVFKAHRSHLYQRLIKIGYGHRAVATLYLALAIVLGACSYIYLQANQLAPVLALIAAGAVTLALFLGVTLIERRKTP